MIDTSIIVRHPKADEVPAELMIGFEAWKIDPEWQWVLEADGKIVAQLLTANMHGMLYLLRITALPSAPNGWTVALLRHMLREGKRLGLIGYMVLLQDDSKACRRMMRIIHRAGGFLEPICGVLAVGRLEVGY